MPFANAGGVRLHYRIDGDAAAPPLVLSNSLGASLEMWEPQMAELSARFRVIRYDTRGHGESEVAPGPYTIAMLGADVVALLDALAIPRAHFCGLSMGGMTGMWLGVNAPERIDRLVLANTAAKIGSADLWNARIDAIRNGGMAAVASGVLARWFTPAMLGQPTTMVSRLSATFERIPAEGYVACCAAVRDMDQRSALSSIRVPTLVIAGSVDLSTPPDDGRYLADHIPGARYVELPAPHLSNVEAAPAFTQALLQFLTAPKE